MPHMPRSSFLNAARGSMEAGGTPHPWTSCSALSCTSITKSFAFSLVDALHVAPESDTVAVELCRGACQLLQKLATANIEELADPLWH